MHDFCVKHVIFVVFIVKCMKVMSQCGTNPLLITQEHSKSSYIISPNYPQNYTINTHCEWNIKAETVSYDDHLLKFEVVDFLVMGNSGCTTDYVELVAETRNSHPKNVVRKSVGRWCGKRYSKFLEIPGDVTLTFRSDALNTSRGFKIKIDLIKASDLCNSTVRINTTTALYGSYLEAVQEYGPTEGFMYSPGYPFGLYRQLKCVWELGLPEAKFLYSGTIHLENNLLQVPTQSPAIANSPGDIHIMENWEEGKEYRYRIDEYFFYRSSTDYLAKKTITITFNRTSLSPKYEHGFRLMMYPHLIYRTSCYADLDVLTAVPEPSFIDVRDSGYNFNRCAWMISSGNYIGGDKNRVIVIEVLEIDFDWSTAESCDVFTVEDQNRSLLFDNKCKSGKRLEMPILIRSYGVTVVVKFNIDTKLNRLFFKFYSRNKYDFSENPVEAVENRSYMWMVAPAILEKWITEPIRWLFTTKRPGKCIEVGIVNTTASELYTRQYFRAFDGIDESADEIMVCPYRQQWGQLSVEGSVSSTGGSMFVIINTMQDPATHPILFYYSATDNCGTDIIELTPATQNITSINVDVVKPHKNVLCRWKIPTEGNHVQMISTTELSPVSTDNFLAAYNSLSPERIIGKWSHSDDSVISSGKHLYLKLQVDETTSGNFHFNYFNVNTSVCCPHNNVIQLTSDSDVYLSSASYPIYYPMNCVCTWHIRAVDSNHVVSLHVEEMDLQTALPDGQCADRLAVYHGNTVNTASLITVLCGRHTNLQDSFITKEPRMVLQFTTDGDTSAKGFKLRLKSVSANITNMPWNSRLRAQTTSQYVSYSGDSVSCDKVCTWMLDSPKNHVTHIEVIQLHIPCTDQFLEIVDVSDSKNHPSFGKLCGYMPFNMIGPGVKFNISFHLASTRTPVVIKIKYYTEPKYVENPCRNTTLKLKALYKIAKTIKSVHHPQMYSNNLLCRWELHTETRGLVIQLVTTRFSIELTDDCTGDYVEIYDGHNTSTPRLNRWCSTETPTYHSSSETMLVIFTTDFAIADTGFEMTYMAIKKPKSGMSTASIFGIVLAVFLIGLIICSSIMVMRRKKHRAKHISSEKVQYMMT